MSYPADCDVIWQAVDGWTDRHANRPGMLAYHGLDVVWGCHGASASQPMTAQVRSARADNATFAMLARHSVARLREVVDGPLVVFKGPEIAALYRHSEARFSADVDVLTPDATRTWSQLVSAGFGAVEAIDPPGHFHLPPLLDPTTGVAVEVHHQPGWVAIKAPPSVAELFERAVPSATGVAGVLTLCPLHHAAALAAHIARSGCLSRAGEALDLLLCLAAAGDEMAEAARAWGMTDLHDRLATAARWIFELGPRPSPLWARLCRHAHDGTVPAHPLPRLRRFVALTSCSSASHAVRYGARGWRRVQTAGLSPYSIERSPACESSSPVAQDSSAPTSVAPLSPPRPHTGSSSTTTCRLAG